MQLLSPWMLLTLGLIPLIILIHALKPKPQQIEVTNLFLWKVVWQERGLNLRLERFKRNLPLVFQILIVSLAAVALARPVWFYFTENKGNMILVVDTSASMKTKAAEGTRFDRAKEKALALVAQRQHNQKILIIAAGHQPVLKTGFIESKQQAIDVVASLKPADSAGKLEKAVYLALSFVDPAKDDRIYLITDGAGFDLASLLQIHPRIVPVLVSGGENNVGITKFEFRQEIDRQDHYEIMLEVKNFNPNPVNNPIRLFVDDTEIFDTNLALAAYEKKLMIFPYSGLITGIAGAVVDIDDDFSVDNAAHLALSTTKDIWVLLVSPGNYFLEKLLQAYPNFMVNAVKEIIPSSWQEQTQRHDIVIVDRTDFPATEKGNFFLIDAYSPSIPVLKTGQIDAPQILDWDRRSPLMANVDLGRLAIKTASRLQAPVAVRAVVEASNTGLLYTYEENGLRAVLLGFDLTSSDLPLKVAFPVMMSNIVNWLNPHKLNFSTLHTKAGEPFDIYLDPQTAGFSVRPPGAKWVKHQVSSNPYTYTNTDAVGIYAVAENDKWRYFTVNLLDESESQINSVPVELSDSLTAAADAPQKIVVQQPLWPLLLLVGLVFIILEWYFWLKVE